MDGKNLLFILSDEHNREALGCYGHAMVKTPHLDGLAARGVRFTSAYTNCPICVPARASLATGRYVHQIGYWDNAFPYEGRVKGWGHRLMAAGHRVEAIGKLHYRQEGDDDGFGRKILPLNVVDGIGDVMGSIRDEIPVRRGFREGVLKAGPGDSTYLRYDEEIAEKAVAWLREAGEAERREKPWMLYVGFVCPHPPFVAPPELYGMYPLEEIVLPVQNKVGERPEHPALAQLRETLEYEEPFTEEEIRRVTAAYYGACTHLDRQVGKVLRALEEAGLEGETRVIYTSDHGESMGRRGLWGKFTMYEESVGVPLIVAGDGVARGGVSGEVVTLVDGYPTILEGLGVDLTGDEKGLPGRSLWGAGRGGAAGGGSGERAAGGPGGGGRMGFSEYHALASTGASYMVREGRYKYVYYVGYAAQLFDLAADPGELVDLAASIGHAGVLERMKGLLFGLLDPEGVDARAKADQAALIERYGGREAVLGRGTFVNSPVPGEKVTVVAKG